MLAKVTVILPVFNAASTIQAAVESILSQTYAQLHLLIINDGSTDRTRAVIDQYASCANVTVVHRENNGLIETLNYALSVCDGDYIARMDADDIAYSDRIPRQVAFMEANPDVVCCGTAVEYFGDKAGVMRFPLTHADCMDTLLLGSCFAHPTVMMRASVIGRFDLRYDKNAVHAEDYALWCELARYGKLANMPFVGLKYRIHSGQVSKAKRQEQMGTHIEINRKLRARLGLPVLSTAQLDLFLFGARSGKSHPFVEAIRALGVLYRLNRPWRNLNTLRRTLKLFFIRQVVRVSD
jgi:glycosyltransferase involved in cell wall biosynthesis